PRVVLRAEARVNDRRRTEALRRPVHTVELRRRHAEAPRRMAIQRRLDLEETPLLDAVVLDDVRDDARAEVRQPYRHEAVLRRLVPDGAAGRHLILSDAAVLSVVRTARRTSEHRRGAREEVLERVPGGEVVVDAALASVGLG